MQKCKWIVLSLVLILAASQARAQEDFELSCDDVVSIQVWRLRGQPWKYEITDGHCYVLIINLTDAAAMRLEHLHTATPETPINVDGHQLFTKRIDLITPTRRIISDAPAWDAFREGHAIISKKTEEDAFAAARAVCPAKVPKKLLTDGS